MKKSLLVPAICGISISILLAFQNCAEPLPHLAVVYERESGSSGAPIPGTPSPLPTLPSSLNWAAGEAFNYPDLPAALKSQMVLTQLVELGYSTYSGPKAVAITASGLGMARRALAGVTQAQIEKMALDSCYAISGGQPCMVVAVGNTWKVSRAALNGPFTGTLATPTTISGATIPFMSPTEAANLTIAYNAAMAPKAIAVGLDGSYLWVASTPNEPIADGAEAQRLALERCEMGAGAIPCTIFAEGSNILFNPANIRRSLSIDYNRTAVSTNIPGMRSAIYNTYVRDNYLINGGDTTGAIYIAADGRAGLYYGTIDADVQAKNYCQGGASSANPCFRYAAGATIQNLRLNINSLKVYGMNMHCKVVPRLTCADHINAGCAAGGQYYTVQSGSVSLSTCP